MLLVFAEGAVAGGSFMVSVDAHRQAEVQEEAEVKEDVGGDQGDEDVGDDQGHVEEEG